jgi:hypothetical protein
MNFGSAGRLVRSGLLTGSVAAALAGCGTLPNGRGWGQDATLLPGLHRMGRSALTALRDPATWAPAAGAAVFGLTPWDKKVSTWASDKTPIFGSRRRAGSDSDWLKEAGGYGVILTGLAAPGGDDPVQWTVSKAKGLGIEVGTWTAASHLTDPLKAWAHRERPDGSDRKSLPSLHSTKAFTYAGLGQRNADALPISPGARLILKSGFTGFAAATAWARIEAKKHYPSDVLAGAALGNFISVFSYDTFMGMDEPTDAAVSIEPSRRGAVVTLYIGF